jgi:nucleoside-diphosphate-sugar epimerase
LRLLVTGHKGYIGTAMIPLLVAEGHHVVGLDSDLYAQCTFGEKTRIRKVPELKKDIRDVEAADIEGFDAVIHLAGLSNDPLGNLNPKLTYEINHAASVRLARLAKAAGVKRYIFSSSCSNYGAAGQDWVDEEADLKPLTPYGRAKVLVEEDVRKLGDENFCPVFPRNATAYGFSPRLRFDLVLNNLVAWAFATGKVHLKSDGTAWRPLVHVEDITRAFIAILNAPAERVHNQAFNIGTTEENYRVRDLADIVTETVPGSWVEFAEGASADQRCYRVKCDKLARLLPEFKPKWNVRLGAEELYGTFKKHGLRLDEFEGPRYKRVAHVKKMMETGRLDETLRWKR